MTPDLISLDDASLERELATLAAHINAATHRFLLCLRLFDAREAWAKQGALSCAHWLNWRIGIDLGAAREKVRVAKALGELPQVSACFARGEVSYSKVRALTRIATPENESDLLAIALAGTASHLEKIVRAYRRGEQSSATQTLLASRFARAYYDDEGMLVLQARLPAAEGALLLRALQSCETALGRDAEAPEQRRADALTLLAERAFIQGHQGDRYQVVVHTDLEVLEEPTQPGRCQLEDGPDVSAETSRRLCCDGSIVAMRHGSHGAVLDVGRKTRVISPALRRALRERDGGCRFPGCTATHWVDGHHILHWAQGGETKLANLVLLCRRHHRLVHEGGYRVTLERGELGFIAPSGDALATAGKLDPQEMNEARRLAWEHAQGLRIDELTAPVWGGESMDYDWALSSLTGAHANEHLQFSCPIAPRTSATSAGSMR